YPDANMTMRLTYGQCLPYSPKDAVFYRHYTTLEGVMEKEDPGNYEFRVPERLKAIYKSRRFSRYADTQTGRIHTCFLTNNDITGGNSGSPVLNANGELIGLAFDGNWESMSSDVMFEPDLQRCITVDIRYVLLIIEELGEAHNLINEMTIK
ncbi:MAG: S46 family peptidase, partial [Bacteroidales bacterium]|nr:S46 family peptidase [Bacteroidales bacterium]